MNLLEGHLEESARASPNFDQASGVSEAQRDGESQALFFAKSS